MHVTGHPKPRNGKYQLVVQRHYDDGRYFPPKTKNTDIKVDGKGRAGYRKADRLCTELKNEHYEIMKAELEAEQKQAKLEKDPLFLDALLAWLKSPELDIRENTRYNYLSTFEHHYATYPPFQGVHLTEVTSKMIKQYYKSKQEDGLCNKTINKHHANFSKFFKEQFAADDSLLEVNPMARVIPPRPDQVEVGQVYSDKEIEALKQLFRGDPIESVIVLNTFYGLRRSEIAGLLWDKVNFATNYIEIRRALISVGGGRIKLTSDLKTEASKRALPMSPEIRDYLLQLKAIQEENQKKFGSAYDDTGYVCCWPDGSPIRPDYITSHFNQILKKGGLRKIRFYDLRHTAITQLFNDGRTVNDAQGWAGHSRASTTLDIYNHASNQCSQELGLCRSRHVYSQGTESLGSPAEGTAEGTPA